MISEEYIKIDPRVQLDLPSTLIARVQIPSANDFKCGLIHLKIIIKNMLNRNKELTVDKLNTNGKQKEGKKCDFFLLTDTDFNRITEICK